MSKPGAPKQKRVIIPEMVGKDELAEFFNLSKRMIERWEEDGLPKNTDGPRNMYNLKGVFDWRYAKIEQKSLTELDIEKLRETKAKADLKELEAAEKKGLLLPIDIILKLWQQNIINSKTAFRGLVSDMKTNNQKIKQEDLDFLKRRITEILQELSEADAIPGNLKRFISEYDEDMDTTTESETE